MLAMFNDIEACRLLRLIRTHRRDGIDDFVKEETADDGERISDDRRDDLRHQEVRIAVEKSVRASRIDGRRRKETRRDRPPGAAEAVHAECVERIIVAHLLLEHRNSAIADSAADETDEDGGHRRDEASGRRDGDETGDAAGRRAEHCRLAAAHPLEEHPADCRGGRRALRRDERVRRECVRAERRAGIEAEPAEPEERRAEHRHRQIVREHCRPAVAAALAEQDAERETGDTGEDVDDEAARKVERAELREEAAAPDPVRHRVVDEDGPEQDEERERAELHALRERTRDERRRDDGEHALERDERELGNRAVLENVHADVREAELLKAADEAADVRTERHRITEDQPLDGNHRDDEETLHDGREHVLAPHHATVKEAKTRCHEENQGRADEDPGSIARVNHKNQSFRTLY